MLYLTGRRWESVAVGSSSGLERMPGVSMFEIEGESVLPGSEAYKGFSPGLWELWERILAPWSTDIPEKLTSPRRFWMNE